MEDNFIAELKDLLNQLSKDKPPEKEIQIQTKQMLQECFSLLETFSQNENHPLYSIDEMIQLYNDYRRLKGYGRNTLYSSDIVMLSACGRLLSSLFMYYCESSNLDDKLNNLRSFGRTGEHMASMFCSRAFEEWKPRLQDYISKSLSFASKLWESVGLELVSRFKTGKELQDILDDVWNILILRLKFCPQEPLELATIAQLRSLLPYLEGNRVTLLAELTKLSSQHEAHDRHQRASKYLQEALSILDDEHVSPENLPAWKQSRQDILLRLSECSYNQELYKESKEYCDMQPQPDHPSCLLMLVKVFSRMESPDLALNTARRVIQSKTFPAAHEATKIVADMLQFNSTSMGLYQELYRNFPEHKLLSQLDLLTQLIQSKDTIHQVEAHKVVERIRGEYQRHKPSAVDCQRIFGTIFEASALEFEQKHYQDALEWACQASSFACGDEEQSCVKRLLAEIQLAQGAIDRAQELINEGLRIKMSRKMLLTQFKILLRTSNNERQTDALRLLVEDLRKCEGFVLEDLCCFVEEACNVPNSSIAAWLLEQLIELGLCRLEQADFPNTEQWIRIGWLIQYLIWFSIDHDLHYSIIDQAKIAVRALEIIPKTKTELLFGSTSVIKWIAKAAMNEAYKADSAEGYIIAYQVLNASVDDTVDDNDSTKRLKLLCLKLYICRRMRDHMELEREQLVKLEQIISECRELQVNVGCTNERYNLTWALFLVKIRLHDPNLEVVFNESKQVLQPEALHYLHLGTMCQKEIGLATGEENWNQVYNVAVKCFQFCLQLLLQRDQVPADCMAVVFRRLINLTRKKEEALKWWSGEHFARLGQLQQVCKSLELRLPDKEARWFVATSWNMGITCIRSNAKDQGKKFVAYALTFLQDYPDLQNEYGIIKQQWEKLQLQNQINV